MEGVLEQTIMTKCANCGKDISKLIDWDPIIYGPEFCSIKCAEEYKPNKEPR